MKILVVGAKGAVGQAACDALAPRHEIITAGRTSGDYCVDMADMASIEELFQRVGRFEALVSCAGDATFATLEQYTHESFLWGLQQKLMGQVNLVLAGLDWIEDRGSFTLTSGVLDRDPIRLGANAAAANGALAGFTKSAAIELARGLRINVVSPGLLDVSVAQYGDLFQGHKPVSSSDVGRAFVKSVEGALTGQVLIVE